MGGADVIIERIEIPIISLKIVKENTVCYECGTDALSGPLSAAKLIGEKIGDSDRENFMVVCLNTKNKINAISIVSIGTVNQALVSPREVFKIALISNATSIILGHNHPSGVLQPSNEDMSITRRLVEAGVVIDIPVLDHIIVTPGGRYLSMKKEGLMNFDATVC